MAFELLLERCQRAVGLRCELLDRDVAKDVGVDHLFEIVVRLVDITQDLTFEAAVALGDDKIYQLGDFNVFGGLVVDEIVILQIGGDMGEEAAENAVGGHRDVVHTAAVIAMMGIGDVERKVHIQMEKYALKEHRRIIDHNLLKRAIILGEILHIVVANAQIEDITARNLVMGIAIVDMLLTANNVANGATRERE